MRDSSEMGPDERQGIGQLQPFMWVFFYRLHEKDSCFSTWKPQLVQLDFPPSEQFGEVNTFSPKQHDSLVAFRLAIQYRYTTEHC